MTGRNMKNSTILGGRFAHVWGFFGERAEWVRDDPYNELGDKMVIRPVRPPQGSFRRC